MTSVQLCCVIDTWYDTSRQVVCVFVVWPLCAQLRRVLTFVMISWHSSNSGTACTQTRSTCVQRMLQSLVNTCPSELLVPCSYLSLKTTCPWKLLVPENYLSVDITCPWKLLVIDNYLSLKTTCPWKLLVPDNYLSLETTCH